MCYVLTSGLSYFNLFRIKVMNKNSSFMILNTSYDKYMITRSLLSSLRTSIRLKLFKSIECTEGVVVYVVTLLFFLLRWLLWFQTPYRITLCVIQSLLDIATPPREWSGSTGVIPQTHRKQVWYSACAVFQISCVKLNKYVSEDTGGPHSNNSPLPATHVWCLWCYGDTPARLPSIP